MSSVGSANLTKREAPNSALLRKKQFNNILFLATWRSPVPKISKFIPLPGNYISHIKPHPKRGVSEWKPVSIIDSHVGAGWDRGYLSLPGGYYLPPRQPRLVNAPAISWSISNGTCLEEPMAEPWSACYCLFYPIITDLKLGNLCITRSFSCQYYELNPLW